MPSRMKSSKSFKYSDITANLCMSVPSLLTDNDYLNQLKIFQRKRKVKNPRAVKFFVKRLKGFWDLSERLTPQIPTRLYIVKTVHQLLNIYNELYRFYRELRAFETTAVSKNEVPSNRLSQSRRVLLKMRGVIVCVLVIGLAVVPPELADVRIRDINFVKRVMIVPAYNRRKTKKRFVVLPTAVSKMMKSYLDACRELGWVKSNDDFFFFLHPVFREREKKGKWNYRARYSLLYSTYTKTMHLFGFDPVFHPMLFRIATALELIKMSYGRFETCRLYFGGKVTIAEELAMFLSRSHEYIIGNMLADRFDNDRIKLIENEEKVLGNLDKFVEDIFDIDTPEDIMNMLKWIYKMWIKRKEEENLKMSKLLYLTLSTLLRKLEKHVKKHKEFSKEDKVELLEAIKEMKEKIEKLKKD